MKKTIFLVFFFVALYAVAQTRFGFKAGVDVTNIRNIHWYSKSRVGFQAGVFATIPLSSFNDQFYFQPELLYLQAGERNEYSTLVNEKYNFDYIALPIILRAYFSDRESDFFAEFGPQFAYLISDKVKTQNNAARENPNETYNKMDVALALGLGYSINRSFEIGLRYSYGITDGVKNDAINKTNNSSNLQFTLAYRLQ